jgi:hypothetical protein
LICSPERRLGDVDNFSRAPEIQFFSDSDEILQVTQFHIPPGNSKAITA